MDLSNNSGKSILLIDDERDITDLIEDILLKEGFKNITKAHCGLDGIKICKDEKPDVIVLDIMLPDIDGIEVCKRIRQFSGMKKVIPIGLAGLHILHQIFLIKFILKKENHS